MLSGYPRVRSIWFIHCAVRPLSNPSAEVRRARAQHPVRRDPGLAVRLWLAGVWDVISGVNDGQDGSGAT